MRFALILISILLALSFAVFAQSIGCCCDPVLRNGSFSTQADCISQGFFFAGPPPSLLVTCSQHCNATLLGTGAACGNGICESSENSVSCPSDCLPQVGACGSPSYKESPSNFVIASVQGEKSLRLSFSIGCPVDFVTISRCDGSGCTNFQKIAEIPPSAFFIDESDNLEFNKIYTYSVVANYRVSGASNPAIKEASLGDLECWGKKSSSFCISSFFYNQYDSYLKTFGYGLFSSNEFETSFESSVDNTFATRLNKAWVCDSNNLLSESSPRVSCSGNEFCISDEFGARCAKPEPCSIQGDPFGLFGSQTLCEGLIPKYCFFDKSTTVADRCYSCNPRMSCYDYKSESSCERDNCHAGECEWHASFDDLGIGVCVDKTKNNCLLCNETGTVGMENLNSSSIVLNACSEEKSTALSTQGNPCFFDKDLKQSKSCDDVSCSDYTQVQCASSSQGVKLNGDNTIALGSSDVCGVKVCEYHDSTGCIKNADGNTGIGFQDCKAGNKSCELDYFPPTTTIIPSGVAGRIDKVTLRVFDKVSRSSPPKDFAGKPGYQTFLCIKTPSNQCSNSASFNIVTSSRELLLKNGDLKEGTKKLADLDVGDNTIIFFSKDSSKNVEVLKSGSVYACENCNPPALLNVSITGGRVFGSGLYTSALKPTVRFEFDEPTQLTQLELTDSDGVKISLNHKTPGMVSVHEFESSNNLDGIYTLNVNGHNSENVYFDPPGLIYNVVVNTSLAGVSVYPYHGMILNVTSISASLNFTDLVTLNKILLIEESYADPFVKVDVPRDVTSFFNSNNNRSFTASITNITGGGYRLVIDAVGYNTLPIYKEVNFFVSTQKPGLRLVSPSFGVTPYSVFNATIETPLPSACSYVYDVPSAPNSADFDIFKKMSGLDILHTVSDLTIPFGYEDAKLLHVYCKFDRFGIIQRSFNITFDPDPVEIINAFAEPSIISEKYYPDVDLYVTTLKVELDKEGFCKYSNAVSTFDSMEGFFPGFTGFPKRALNVDVNETAIRDYSYFVTCKGKNGLLSAPASVKFKVDLTLPLNVSSSTPIGFSSTNFTIGVVANKRVFCYFGEREDDATKCMGACRAGYTNSQEIRVQTEGRYTYYVVCSHVSGAKSGIIEIPVLVDTSPPVMEYVDDKSSLEDSEITWSLSKLRVAFKASDDESNISHYLVSIKNKVRNIYVVKDLVSNVTHGNPFYVSLIENGTIRLADGEQYIFIVKALNLVGLESEPMESDGVLVDISQTPGQCMDDEENGDETDVDCGGSCDGCAENLKCSLNGDCASNYCDFGLCKIASCEDGFANGLETDVDCGGANCNKCKTERFCIVDSDCETDYCNPINKVCEVAPPCADKQLSVGESDIDCGGPCAKCIEGKSCTENADCAENLKCDSNKVCSQKALGDSDGDGIIDEDDKCPSTPLQESPDETGCSLSQKFSMGDTINDKWRLDYFGCIDCTKAEGTADPDGDGLINIDEFMMGTNPTDDDTDGDGWEDGSEVKNGTDPLNPDSHPDSKLLWLLWFVFVGLIIAGAYYGGQMFMKWRKENKNEFKEFPVDFVPKIPEVKAELEQLKAFAKREQIPKEEWVSLEKEIKHKPLPKKKFHRALEKLRKIAHKNQESENPIDALRELIGGLSSVSREQMLEKIRQKHIDSVELDSILHKLKITAEYYNLHKKEIEEELLKYGKR